MIGEKINLKKWDKGGFVCKFCKKEFPIPIWYVADEVDEEYIQYLWDVDWNLHRDLWKLWIKHCLKEHREKFKNLTDEEIKELLDDESPC